MFYAHAAVTWNVLTVANRAKSRSQHDQSLARAGT